MALQNDIVLQLNRENMEQKRKIEFLQQRCAEGAEIIMECQEALERSEKLITELQLRIKDLGGEDQLFKRGEN